MFWGRLAAWRAGVPVIASALHSTGLPDHVEWPNRLLAPLTDAFIAVAESHGRFLAEREGCPTGKIRVIPNGVDVDRFRPQAGGRQARTQWGWTSENGIVGIVAALRPEKNHELFLDAAFRVVHRLPTARFLVVGDGPRRPQLEARAAELGLQDHVRFLGTRHDVPNLLSAIDVFVLSSRMEASPVSILEAQACARPVVAPAVGSIPEAVIDGQTGCLVPPDDSPALADRLVDLLCNEEKANGMGRAGRQRVVENYSVAGMVKGYQDLIESIYRSKCRGPLVRPAEAVGVAG
jgi:glycosyltransferase involved in cell wall biosynthesis